MVCLYKWKLTDNLDSLCYTMSCQKVACSKLYNKSKVLPPTSAAARYHCLRVLYQVRQWMGEGIKAHEWGWAITDIQMQAKYINLGYAQDELLSQIRCKCKTNWHNVAHAESTDLFVPLPVVNVVVWAVKTQSTPILKQLVNQQYFLLGNFKLKLTKYQKMETHTWPSSKQKLGDFGHNLEV